MQGRTGHFEKLHPIIAAGQWRVLGTQGISLFVSPLDLTAAQWHLSFAAPEGHAAELNERWKDITLAQVIVDANEWNCMHF